MDVVMEEPTIEAPEFRGFEEDALVEKHSHLFGSIRLYAPLGPVEHWPSLPFLLQTQHGDGGQDTVGVKHIIKASAIKHALNHVSLIGPRDLWVGPEVE